jgi:integrase
MKAQHTKNHLNCPACEETRRAIMYSGHFAGYAFPKAARLWLQGRKRLAPTTRVHYEAYIKALESFFGECPLKDIHIGQLVEYQKFRQEQIRESKQFKASATGRATKGKDDTDGASSINHEVSCVLRQVLAHAGLWSEIEKRYEPLPLSKVETGMALSPEEEEHLFKVGRSKPRWMIAYCADMISRNTTAGPGEIRHLRLKDIDLENRIIHVEEGVKNDFLVRPLPLNDDALWAIEWLLRRYHKICRRHKVEPNMEHFLLPHRAAVAGGKPDMFSPLGSWKKAHYAMRKEAAKKFPRLTHLRRYDFRHTAATDMMDNPAVSWSTIEHMMGHRIGSKVKRKYEHRRNASLRACAEALNHGHVRARREEAEAAARVTPANVLTWRPSVAQAAGD